MWQPRAKPSNVCLSGSVSYRRGGRSLLGLGERDNVLQYTWDASLKRRKVFCCTRGGESLEANVDGDVLEAFEWGADERDSSR